MTDTRIIDAEVYELRYPTILRQFSTRKCSGGKGQCRGGDGVVREIEFGIPLSVSMLSERRVYGPYGMAAGGSGQVGLNFYVKKEIDGKECVIDIGNKMELNARPGERIIINTPGGGAWGASKENQVESHSASAGGISLIGGFEPRGSLHERNLITAAGS